MDYKLIFALGRAEAKTVGYVLPSIEQVVKLGVDKYTELVKNKVIVKHIDKSTIPLRVVDIVPQHIKQLVIELDRQLLTKPARVTKNKKGYFIPLTKVDDQSTKWSYRPLVKSSYLFQQRKQDDCFGELVARQNKIKMKIWKDVLSFHRQPKEGVADDNFNEESKLFANTVSSNDSCYLSHEYDYRGRLYANGILSYQGDEWCKAALSPCLGIEPLTFSGECELKYYLASHFGFDKLTYSERNAKVVNGECSDIVKAKEPILATKTLQMFNKAKVGDKFSGTVSIDATNSGFQILALATGDAELAKMTNLTDNSQVYDFYAHAASKITTDPDMIAKIRPYIKKALMGVAYNSQALPREMGREIASILGETPALFLASKKWKEAIQISPIVERLKDKLNGIICAFGNGRLRNGVADKSKYIIRWTMPDGFTVEMPLKKSVGMSMLTDAFRGNFMINELGWDREQNFRGLVPNIIHSIDAYICRSVIRAAADRGIKVVSIHDCFVVHPNHAPLVKRLYAAMMHVINRMNIIDDIIRQIDPSESYTKEGQGFIVTKRSYALC